MGSGICERCKGSGWYRVAAWGVEDIAPCRFCGGTGLARADGPVRQPTMVEAWTELREATEELKAALAKDSLFGAILAQASGFIVLGSLLILARIIAEVVARAVGW